MGFGAFGVGTGWDSERFSGGASVGFCWVFWGGVESWGFFTWGGVELHGELVDSVPW